MHSSIRDAYLETEVLTATPQRLRLMLIDAALRRTREADAALASEQPAVAQDPLVRAREIVGELLAGIRPDESPLAKTVLGLYAFLLSTLAEVGQTRDRARLAGVIRVLEEERSTWQTVCQQFPDRPEAAAASCQPREELAPSHVSADWTSASPAAAQAKPTRFSIDA
jgi:flagellar secretion chaperone FliS